MRGRASGRWSGSSASVAPYTLDDPRPIAAEAPYTFFLPEPVDLEGVRTGDHVQLLFRPTAEDTKFSVERMWVKVSNQSGDDLSGILDKMPEDVPNLHLGDVVSFKLWHVIGIEPAHPRETARTTPRQYWERCLVDDCVLNDGIKAYFVYREEPDMGGEGCSFEDSGWRIRGDYRGVSDEELDARSASYVALGTVLNRDDSWLHLLDDAPPGAGFLWNFEDEVWEEET